ncbi:hypothetical protein DY000_02023091 [Brassica cretica]|uniref:Uncharacterized protein n=1 Tax=Brassica cretica TaxID=69181 RepID=A0ABQ7E454_BRACR|nr:hypothetical protein DY000_02023091 [Brassica cretica]
MATVMSEVRFFTSATILVSEREQHGSRVCRAFTCHLEEQHGYWSFLLVTCQDPYINPCNSDIFKWGLSELFAFWLAVSAHCGGDGSGGGERGSPRGRDPGQTGRGGEKEIRIGKYNSMNRIKIFTKKKENRNPGQTGRGGEKEIRIGKYNSMNRIKIFTKKKENRSETVR